METATKEIAKVVKVVGKTVLSNVKKSIFDDIVEYKQPSGKLFKMIDGNIYIFISPKEYEMVINADSNREAVKSHLPKMSKSIKEIGPKRLVILHWNEKLERFETIDGHHMFTIRKEESHTILCQVCEVGLDKNKVMRLLNTVAKKWKFVNFLNNVIKDAETPAKRKRDYELIGTSVAENHPTIPQSIVLAALSGETREKASELFSERLFVVTTSGVDMLNKMKQLHELGLSSNGVSKRLFTETLLTFMREKSYNHNKMISAIKNNKHKNMDWGTTEKKIALQLKNLCQI